MLYVHLLHLNEIDTPCQKKYIALFTIYSKSEILSGEEKSVAPSLISSV